MDTNNSYNLIEQRIHELKNPIKLTDLGSAVCITFGSFIGLIVLAIITLLTNLCNSKLTICLVNTIGGLLISSIVSIVGFVSVYFSYKHKEFKYREIAIYFLLLLIIFFNLLFQWYKHIDLEEEMYPMCYSISCVISSLIILILMSIKYFNSPTIESRREAKRILHTNVIKYYFLGIISGDDSSLENCLKDNKIDPDFDFGKKNKGMINKIRSTTELKTRTNSFLNYCSVEINKEITALNERIKFSYAAALFSSVVSLCITSYSKIVDAVNNYISALWKAEYSIDSLIEGIPADKAVELSHLVMQYTILFQILLILFLIVGFFFFSMIRNYINQRDTNRLNNFKISLCAIWDLQHM